MTKNFFKKPIDNLIVMVYNISTVKIREVNKMNKEVIKAMNKKETKIDELRKWWNKNGHKVTRVVLFPVWWGIKAKDKVATYLNSREEWNEEKAKEILNYYIPRSADWNADDKCFYFFDNGYGWSMNIKKYIKRKDRRFWNIHRGFSGGKIRSYLINEFELEGFKKEVGDCNGWTEITFTMIEK